MKRKFKNNPKLKFIIGDIRDYNAVYKATKGIDYVFHLAALKHVPVCEENVQETIKTNIDGTINIVNASIENRVKKVIDVSSDKAVEPINLYGMTKSVGEKTIIQANDLSDYTKFVCIRGGNVMGSSGSVIPLFIEQIKSKGPITITDLKMTRFFLTLEEAINLLFKASIDCIGGETFVMNMPACYIKDLAEVLMQHYGKVDVLETGIRPGEKLDETLISHHESKLSFCYDNNYFLTLPVNYNQNLSIRYQGLKPFPFKEFSSKTKILNKAEIKEMLSKGKFL
jgi:FlaA1/EpsC-like NDP-sugar epimerase